MREYREVKMREENNSDISDTLTNIHVIMQLCNYDIFEIHISNGANIFFCYVVAFRSIS